MKRRSLTAIFFAVPLLAATCDEELAPPQIGLDVSPVICQYWPTGPDQGPYVFNIQLYNRGEATLVIDKIVVKGDQYCSFEFEGPDTKEMSEDESAYIRGYYHPALGYDIQIDQISLEVHSNSEEHGVLIIPVCGKGIPPGTEDPGPPISCNVPPSSQPDCPYE
jgi:hypothetical protein